MVLFAALDGTGWAVVVAAVGLVLSQLYKMRIDDRRERERINREAKAAKVVADKLDEQTTIGKETFHLVNSGSLAMLKLHAVSARRLATKSAEMEARGLEKPGSALPDMLAADEAEKLVREHEEKQAVIDAAKAARPVPVSIAAEVRETNVNVREVKEDVKVIVKEAIREVAADPVPEQR